MFPHAVGKPVLKAPSVFLLRRKLHIAPSRRQQLIKNPSFIIQVDPYITAPELENLVDEATREPVIVAAFVADRYLPR